MRAAGLVALISLAVVFTAGCGSAPEGAALADAATKAHGRTARYRLDARVKTSSDDFSMNGVGATNDISTQFTFDGTLAGAGVPKLRMRMIASGEDAWMRSPRFARVLPRGKTWIHMHDRSLADQTITVGGKVVEESALDG